MRKVAQCHFCAFVSLAVTGLGICARSSKAVLTFPLGLLILLAVVVSVFAQDSLPNSPEAKQNNQINVNWLYGSYVPKEVPVESGKMPPPPPAPAADLPILVVVVIHPLAAPAETASAAAPTTLPKTASDWPLVGLLGLLCVGASFALQRFRAAEIR